MAFHVQSLLLCRSLLDLGDVILQLVLILEQGQKLFQGGGKDNLAVRAEKVESRSS